MESHVIEQISSYIGWFIGAAGVVAAILTAIFTRRTGKDNVQVNAKEANTRAVAGVIDALTTGLEELRLEVKDLKDKNMALETTVESQGRTITEQGATIRLLVEERAEMVSHIVQLEEAFPNPPGAPLRPEWLQNL